MTLTFALFFSRNPQRKRRPSLIAFTLCVFFCTAVPALADSVRVNQVVQTITSSQGRPDLKLNILLSQDPVSKVSTQGGPRNESAAGSQGQGGAKAEPVVSGVTI